MHYVPLIEQEGPGSCGPASMRSILAFYGEYRSEAELIEATKCTHEEGTWSHEIVAAAIRYGYDAHVSDGNTIDDLKRELAIGPVIVDWYDAGGHYSVATGITDTEVILMDPQDNTKYRTLEIEDFKNLWFDFEKPETFDSITKQRIIVIRPREICTRDLIQCGQLTLTAETCQ